MKKALIFSACCLVTVKSFCWGFYGHQRINYYAVFLLPPEMMVFYKPNIQFLSDHSVDPDKRRYLLASEASKHYIDIDRYGKYPYKELPASYDSAVKKFSEDTIMTNGIVPWWVQTVQARLTNAFKEKNPAKILKLSAEIGHYVADAHVPLHANSNHDGQLTGQKGIHAFWESRIPELLSEKEFDFMIGKAAYISNISSFIWKRVLESGAEADTVLQNEAFLTSKFATDRKYAFEERNGKLVRQYSSGFTVGYNNTLKGMVERRMRTAITSTASLWYTAWINAGQPNLKNMQPLAFSEEDLKEFEILEAAWKYNNIKGRLHE
ncbi:zinc dependent phospholipase C family protein [Segetibacter aerophilus]|nr:zinc dependent phospholipase C family protein [Segetibacter aerophilus]